jgi:hypothetical protein
MKKVILLLLILIGCNTKSEKVKENFENVIKEPKKTGEKYFDYDEIEYYKIEIEEDFIGELYDNQKKSLKDTLKMGIILGQIPKSISDTYFIDYLKSFGYLKSKIEANKFNKIDEIFTEKKHSELYETACIYIYRDILIFKKKSKIIGIAKICFDCDANVIVGTKSNIEAFGMSGDYEKLREILSQK